MYNFVSLTEEQRSVITQALEYWRYNCQYVNSKQWSIAETVINKINEVIIWEKDLIK